MYVDIICDKIKIKFHQFVVCYFLKVPIYFLCIHIELSVLFTFLNFMNFYNFNILYDTKSDLVSTFVKYFKTIGTFLTLILLFLFYGSILQLDCYKTLK